MKNILNQHTLFIENILEKENDTFDWKSLSKYHRAQIGFFQHERLIHLLITLFFGLIFFISITAQIILINIGNGLIFLDINLSIINITLLIMLSFYIWHYFFLENGVQKLYQLDKKITKHSPIEKSPK